MIHLYTGNGKGKTTAAVGLCIRALGQGFHVRFAQFMKGNDSGELRVLERQPNVEILRSEKNFGFYSSMSVEDKAELTKIHNRILDRLLEAAERGACQMMILDEATYPVNWGLLDIEKLKKLLAFGKEGAEGEIEIVLTGRDAADFLWDIADYVTEMECERHPFEKGVRARKGIEF
ncbi:MAG: cob(I)yrinic acid a,c-diamide adenosyltransferase [Clostridium sp.]|nr:cob(I)yrinic acid a,c-diamide adenosyltransferase [Clostridium sp.]